MLGANQDVLPITDGERLIGMLTAADLRAAFVERPREFGSPERADRFPDPEADVSARDLLDLADRLSI